MYTSSLFQKSLAYAESLHPNRIYILSAKYGAISLNQQISPYNKTLNNMSEKERQEWAKMVCSQLELDGVNFSEPAVFLCGNNYRKYLMQKFKNAVAPLEGVSFGNQLAWYNSKLGKNSR